MQVTSSRAAAEVNHAGRQWMGSHGWQNYFNCGTHKEWLLRYCAIHGSDCPTNFIICNDCEYTYSFSTAKPVEELIWYYFISKRLCVDHYPVSTIQSGALSQNAKSHREFHPTDESCLVHGKTIQWCRYLWILLCRAIVNRLFVIPALSRYYESYINLPSLIHLSLTVCLHQLCRNSDILEGWILENGRFTFTQHSAFSSAVLVNITKSNVDTQVCQYCTLG